MPRSGRAVFTALSARVGSIGDNRLGGWHAYRASKAALNMLLRNYAIEQARLNSDFIVAGLHPGTVDTRLSKPFQGNVPDGQLFTPQNAAAHLLRVIEGLTPADTGKCFDWAGKEIPARPDGLCFTAASIKACEQRMRLERAGFQLRVVLNADEPWVRRDLEDFRQRAVGRHAGE
jgi:NAD(P)-dependent dehydrogenase (short-subunit alcohol dehydrogenase family)